MVEANVLEDIVGLAKVIGVIGGFSVAVVTPIGALFVAGITYAFSYKPAIREYNKEVNGKQLELFPETIEKPNFWKMYWDEIKGGRKV